MNRTQLIQKCKKIMHKTYCNGITVSQSEIVETNETIKIYLDYLVPKRVIEESIEHRFFIRLRNVGLITLSKEGKLISNSTSEEFVQESIEKYKELLTNRERFIIKLFADKLIRLEQIHIALTPLRKVLWKFKERDFRIDNLGRNFVENERKYIHFLNSFGYLRKEGDVYTLDNEFIKKIESKEKIESREKQIQSIIASIFAEHFDYIISELGNTTIVPYVGITATFCNLLLELGKNMTLPSDELFRQYSQHYMSGLNHSSFQDKMIDMRRAGLVQYNDQRKSVSLPDSIYDSLITSFKSEQKQAQLC